MLAGMLAEWKADMMSNSENRHEAEMLADMMADWYAEMLAYMMANSDGQDVGRQWWVSGGVMPQSLTPHYNSIYRRNNI